MNLKDAGYDPLEVLRNQAEHAKVQRETLALLRNKIERLELDVQYYQDRLNGLEMENIDLKEELATLRKRAA